MKWQYNSFNQAIVEFQEHDGPVDLDTSPKLEFAYVDGTGNTIRRESMTMVSGAVQHYEYGTGLPDALRRASAIREGSTVIAAYRYLGLGSFRGVDFLFPLRRLLGPGPSFRPRGGSSRGCVALP